MARVLFLTQVLPYPLDAGPKVRAYHVLRWLCTRHEVTLVSFVRSDTRPSDIQHLQGFCRRVLVTPMLRSVWRNVAAGVSSVFTGQPAVILRDDVLGMRKLIDQTVTETEFDIIHADQTSMVRYAFYGHDRAVQRRPATHPALVLDAHNALYRVPERLAAVERNPIKRWLYDREARLLARYEGETYRRFGRVVFVSEVDRRLFGLESAHVIPICTDPASVPLVTRGPNSHTILHLGTMFWPPNIEGVLWFIREVLPLVRAQVPDARFVIVGKSPPPSITDLASSLQGIEVTGYVPDPISYLADCAAFIVPLRAAGGMRVKIVDAWCWGVPIVTTTIGAEGLDVRAGDNLLVADTPSEFAAAVVDLLLKPGLGERLRANGRLWVEERYNWAHSYAEWDLVYSEALAVSESGADPLSRAHACGRADEHA